MKTALLSTLASLPLALLLAPSPAPTAPPEPVSPLQDPDRDPPHPPTPSVYYYAVEHADAYTMSTIVQELYGDLLPKYNADGEQVGSTENVMVLDDHRILVFDTPDRAQRILTLFADLDVLPPGEAEPSVELASEVYVPRYLTPHDILDGLEPFARSIWDEEVGSRPNLRLLGSSGRILMRDTRAKLDEMLGLLEELDRPSPQLELTCYVLRGTDTPGDTGLPAALTDNLSRLVPFEGFELATMGIVRTGADYAGTGLSLDMEGSDESFSLSARLTAFDDSTEGREVLTIRDCRMMRVHDGVTELFKTDTSIVGGEYAVLGATGSTPVFVVLRFERVAF